MTQSNTAPPRRAATSRRLDAAHIVASIGEVAYEWHIDTDALTWGDNAGAVLGISDLSIIATGGAFAQRIEAGAERTRFDAIMGTSIADQGEGVLYQAQYGLRPAPGGGSRLWIEDIGRWFAGPDGRPVRAHGIVRVITERHAQEQQLAYLSQFDGLTGEINRWRLTEILGATLEDAIRFRGSCGFLLVAVDNLARVNEAYGYDVADEVIAAVAKRLRLRMREADILGRFSGNKFALILNKCTADDIGIAAERLLAGVRANVIDTKIGPVAVTVTIGGVNAPRHARTVDEILSRAMEALNMAKTRRRGSFLAYRPNIEREAQRRENVRAGDEIVSALNERRITIAFEPIVETVSRKLAFHECLMRIRRHDGSVVAAHSIIPVAERLGFVRLLDHRVLELVVAELVAAPDFCASINVSPCSATDPDWWAALNAYLRTHSGLAGRLIIEITESTAIEDLDDTRGFVARAKDLGCRIAIDDFGAGYTSFRNLRKLGVDMIKIDGAFVENMTRSPDDEAFVLTLLDLARRLGLATVAERVQDEAAAKVLAAHGCNYLQGHLIGLATLERALPASGAVTAPLGSSNAG